MRRWSPVVALLAAALALAACGGGEGEDEIAALRSEAAGLEAEIDDLGSEIDALREEVREGGERVAAAEARAAEAGVALGGVEREVGALAREEGDLAAAVVAVRGFAEALGALAPPPAVGGAHAEAVASSAGLADLIAGWPGEIAGVTTFEDLEAAFEEFVTRPEVQAAGERLDAACTTLQDLAQEFEINADLHCG